MTLSPVRNVNAFTPRPGLTMDHAGVAAWCILAPIEMNRHRSRFADPERKRHALQREEESQWADDVHNLNPYVVRPL
jgi:hypothetical protein